VCEGSVWGQPFRTRALKLVLAPNLSDVERARQHTYTRLCIVSAAEPACVRSNALVEVEACSIRAGA
jgi:hypothetical protein